METFGHNALRISSLFFSLFMSFDENKFLMLIQSSLLVFSVTVSAQYIYPVEEIISKVINIFCIIFQNFYSFILQIQLIDLHCLLKTLSISQCYIFVINHVYLMVCFWTLLSVLLDCLSSKTISHCLNQCSFVSLDLQYSKLSSFECLQDRLGYF